MDLGVVACGSDRLPQDGALCGRGERLDKVEVAANVVGALSDFDEAFVTRAQARVRG